jgi:2',3'-cyclic-nucleotide 2'-phosphodiesterase (5'-nucleotidase family)
MQRRKRSPGMDELAPLYLSRIDKVKTCRLTPALGMAMLLFATTATARAEAPDLGAHLPSQSAADFLRESAGTDAAFLPAGMLKNLDSPADLVQLLVYPTDQIAIVKLTGAQIRSACERSLAILPMPTSAFLQLSGMEVRFTPTRAAESRVDSIQIGGGSLDKDRKYRVAMPITLARGGLGYFKVWDRDQIERVIEGQTLESILKGRKVSSTQARWIESK